MIEIRKNAPPYDGYYHYERKWMPMAIIEWRRIGDFKWCTDSLITDMREVNKPWLDYRCRKLATEDNGNEYRWRYGILDLASSDNCEIFKYDDNERKEKKEKNGQR